MPIYNDVFGGANIYPSEISYSAITLTADVTLSWPEETSTNQDLATRIIDVTPAAGGLSVILPDANKTGTGNTILFNNRGANTFTVRNAVGTQVITIAPGTLWQVYLSNNSTVAGVWRSLQYGASISQANASALAGTGIVAVGTLLSQSVPVTTFNSSYAAGVTDRAKMFVWTGGAGGTFTLPPAATVGNNWFCYVRNSGSAQIQLDPDGTPTIDGLAFLDLQPGESAVVVTDGIDFYTIGLGQPAAFAFDYTVVDVSGSGNYTLTGSELNRIAYRFIGTLTGDTDVIVPDTVQQYWVTNDTTGAYNFRVKTSTGAAVALASGQRAIFYCDGTDVVDADSSTVSLPITVSQGGTGAVTASAALINLGGTATGIALFEATDQAAAWAALGIAPAGVVDGGTF